jgi:hypothetical protein
VGGDQDRASLAGEVAQELPDPGDALRVEAVGGLVEQQDLRVAEQRLGEPETLTHAEAELPDPLGGRLLEPTRASTSSQRARGRPAVAAEMRSSSIALRPGW